MLSSYEKKPLAISMSRRTPQILGSMRNYNIIKDIDDGDTYFIASPKDSPTDTHIYVRGDLLGKDFWVDRLKGSNSNTLAAQELYRFLILSQGLTIHSGNAQSEGGAKVWERLSKYQDITVTLSSAGVFSNSQKRENEKPIEKDWKKNFSDEHIPFHFIARKK